MINLADYARTTSNRCLFAAAAFLEQQILLDAARADAVIALHDAKQRTAKINSNLAKQVFK